MPVDISYLVRRSSRAKRLSLRVEPTGQIIVTLPEKQSEKAVESFVLANLSWIKQQQTKTARLERLSPNEHGAKTQHQQRLLAKKLISAKVKYWNQLYGFNYQRISIKNQSSRWGSCSRLGNLNFSYRLLFLPDELTDYIVVHELCHLRELNHGPRFWALVAQAIPDYRLRRQRLANILIQ